MAKYVKKKKRSPLPKLLVCVAALLLLLLVIMIMMIPKKEDKTETTAPTHLTVIPTETETAPETTVEETTIPVETEPQILPELAEMAAENTDMVGWLEIPDTKVDYPLMYTPQERDKYLHKDFNGNFSVGGMLYVDEDCTLEPRSDNLIIYGHNMLNGSMFRSLISYDQQSYWEDHPIVYYSTLYEKKAYEIVAAFYDRVYLKSDDCFKFYQFIDAEDEDDFKEAMTYFKEKALYDTGVTAEYGDNLLTLVTCAYHVENGRFVVVAREVPDSD